jgi:hypothetical protein
MRGKLMFLAGLGAGFVLGARAGREKYEELKATAIKFRENPTVQETTGVLQEQASQLVSTGKEKLSNTRLAETPVGQKLLSGSTTGASGSGSTGSLSSTDSTSALTTAGSKTGSTGSASTATTTGSTSTNKTGSSGSSSSY